jgi:predicted ATP-dependent serine protease
MNDKTATEVGEVSLSGAVEDLTKLSWRLKELVYEEIPTPNGIGNPTPQPADRLTRTRNDILAVNERLSDVADRLTLIGK